MKRFGWLIAGCFVLLLGGDAVASRPVVADLSNHLVAITTGFSGTRVLVFGATDDRKGDIVMVVRGPTGNHVVRQKSRVAGVWVNGDSAVFPQIPAYYAVASTAPLSQVVPSEVRKRHQIGIEALALPAEDGSGVALADDQAQVFREALLRLKRKSGLFPSQVAPVTTLENRLFRAELDLPATVPVGSYSVEVFFVQDGEVVGAEITPLFVSKTGISAEIYDFAMFHSAKYAVVSIVFAALAGWGIALVFRR